MAGLTAQDWPPITPAPYQYQPYGYTQIGATALASAVGLAGGTLTSVPNGTKLAVIACSTANVRWRDDGTAPTATLGMPLNAGQQLAYSGDLSAVKFILVSGSPVLDVSFYK